MAADAEQSARGEPSLLFKFPARRNNRIFPLFVSHTCRNLESFFVKWWSILIDQNYLPRRFLTQQSDNTDRPRRTHVRASEIVAEWIRKTALHQRPCSPSMNYFLFLDFEVCRHCDNLTVLISAILTGSEYQQSRSAVEPVSECDISALQRLVL